MTNSDTVKTYELSGGGSVSVFKPFGDSVYAALTQMDGIYPQDNHEAKNTGRDEFLFVVDGSFQVVIDQTKYSLSDGDSVFIPDGATYEISGKGRSLVIVKDQSGGATEIIPKS